MPKSNDKPRIIVRDRREVHQFSIHNRVIDQWLPIIGLHGLALYNLYVRMSNQADERSWPGYTLISSHLQIGSTTISNYNQLLVWCGLIHIEHGDRKNPNEYYILSVPHCTPAAIKAIEAQAQANLNPKSTFLTALQKRLLTWKPIQEHWERPEKKVVVVHPSQLELPEMDAEGTIPGGVGTPVGEHPTPVGEHPTPVGEHPTPVGEHPTPPGGVEQSETTIQNNNPKQQQERLVFLLICYQILEFRNLLSPNSQITASTSPTPRRGSGTRPARIRCAIPSHS